MDNSFHGHVLHKYDKDQDDELNLVVGDYLIDVIETDDGWCEGTVKETGQRGMFPDNFVELFPAPKIQVQPPLPAQTKPPAPDIPIIRESQVSKKRRAKVTYSYTPDNEDELTLQPGQIVEVIKEVEEGWLEGSLDGKVGVFPSNFVEPLKDAGDPVAPPQLPTKTPEKTRPPSMVAMHGLGGVNPLDLISKLKPVSTTRAPPVPPPDTRSPVENSRIPMERTRTNTGSKMSQRSSPKAKVMFDYKATQDDEITVLEGDIVEIISMNTDQDGWWLIKKGIHEGFVPDNFLEKLGAEKPPPPEPKVLENPPLPPKVVEAPRPNPVIPKGKVALPKLPDKMDTDKPADIPPCDPTDEIDVPPHNGLLDNSKVRQRPRKSPVNRPPSKSNLFDEDTKGPESPPINERTQEDNTGSSSGAPWQQETKTRKSKTNLPAVTTPVTVPTKVIVPTTRPKPTKLTKPLPQATTRPQGGTSKTTGTGTLPPTTLPKSIEHRNSDIESSGEWKEAIESMKEDFQRFKEELKEDMRILTQDLDNERKKNAQLQIDVDRLKKTAGFREKL